MKPNWKKFNEPKPEPEEPITAATEAAETAEPKPEPEAAGPVRMRHPNKSVTGINFRPHVKKSPDGTFLVQPKDIARALSIGMVKVA